MPFLDPSVTDASIWSRHRLVAHLRTLSLLLRPPSVSASGEVATATLLAFHRCFGAKMFSHYLELPLDLAYAAQQALALGALLAMISTRTAWYGAMGLLAVAAYRVIDTWPYTINHCFLELFISATLVVFPLRSVPFGRCQDGRSARLLWFTLLSVWVFAALQKVVQGYYLTGEFVAIPLTYGRDGNLAGFVRGALAALQTVLGLESTTERFPLDPSAGTVLLTSLERFYCVALGWAVVVLEFALPAAVVSLRRSPWAAVASLAAGQLLLGATSGEWSFTVTALAVIGLGCSTGAGLYQSIVGLLLALHTVVRIG